MVYKNRITANQFLFYRAGLEPALFSTVIFNSQIDFA
jgi:hypothetical protein